jgi:hypothetical protein
VLHHWLQEDIISQGRLPLLCCLVAFILTFFVTRRVVNYIRNRADSGGAPRKWWQPANIRVGSIHIHHVMIGVVLVLLSGVAMVTLADDALEPSFVAAATGFGIGAALLLDEYALILHLSDVYWEEDGRTSVDAVFAAAGVAGLLALGFHPLTFLVAIWRDEHAAVTRLTVLGGAVLLLALAVVVLLKGKVTTGLVGMFVVPLLVIGAIRLSRPQAPWARWRYSSRPQKMRRALERERGLRRPVVRAKLWLQDAIAGTPRLPDNRTVDAELDREVHAAPPPDVSPAAIVSAAGSN